MSGEALEALLFAREAAKEASEILREGVHRVQAGAIIFKRGRTDLLTEFDKRSEQCILAAIAREFPGDAVTAEESGAHGTRGARRRWLVDPIDGTTNFAHG